MKNSTIVFLLVLCFNFLGCSQSNQQEIKVVSTEETKILLDLKDVQLIDVRTKEEYDSGHLEKAQNIDFNSPTFDAQISGLDKDKPVVLYCKSGGRSAKSAQKMHDAGFKNIYDLEGGFLNWQSKKLALDLNE